MAYNSAGLYVMANTGRRRLWCLETVDAVGDADATGYITDAGTAGSGKGSAGGSSGCTGSGVATSGAGSAGFSDGFGADACNALKSLSEIIDTLATSIGGTSAGANSQSPSATQRIRPACPMPEMVEPRSISRP